MFHVANGGHCQTGVMNGILNAMRKAFALFQEAEHMGFKERVKSCLLGHQTSAK
jgi:hypothetical protein